MARKLTSLDEWPLHQTLDTFDQVETDSPYWSDGFWNCVGDPDGRVNMITALRFYHNTNVADGYACVSLDDGRQYNVRASRRLRPRIDELEIGPLWMEILEGLRSFRFGCRDNPHGISFDLRWDGAAPAWDETPGQVAYVDGRVAFKRSNYVQVGHVSGEIRVGDRRFEVGPEWVGARDHSWGIGEAGSGGKTNPYAAPVGGPRSKRSKRPGFGMRQWALIRMPTRSIFYWFHHGADGTMSPFTTRVEYPFESGRAGWSYRRAEVESAEFVGGERRLDRAVVAFERFDGKTERFEMETVSHPLYMQGGGYWNGFTDGLGRGIYRGEEHLEGDVYDISHPTVVRDEEGNVLPQKYGAWAETYARYRNLDDPEEQGLGLLECVIQDPYPGFSDA